MIATDLFGRLIRLKYLLDKLQNQGIGRHQSAFRAHSSIAPASRKRVIRSQAVRSKVQDRSTVRSTAKRPSLADVATCFRRCQVFLLLLIVSGFGSESGRTPP